MDNTVVAGCHVTAEEAKRPSEEPMIVEDEALIDRVFDGTFTDSAELFVCNLALIEGFAAPVLGCGRRLPRASGGQK